MPILCPIRVIITYPCLRLCAVRGQSTEDTAMRSRWLGACCEHASDHKKSFSPFPSFPFAEVDFQDSPLALIRLDIVYEETLFQHHDPLRQNQSWSHCKDFTDYRSDYIRICLKERKCRTKSYLCCVEPFGCRCLGHRMQVFPVS